MPCPTDTNQGLLGLWGPEQNQVTLKKEKEGKWILGRQLKRVTMIFFKDLFN